VIAEETSSGKTYFRIPLIRVVLVQTVLSFPMQTGEQTDMTKLIGALRNFAKAPKAREDGQIKNNLPEN